jgi:hypothetical protein
LTEFDDEENADNDSEVQDLKLYYKIETMMFYLYNSVAIDTEYKDQNKFPTKTIFNMEHDYDYLENEYE